VRSPSLRHPLARRTTSWSEHVASRACCYLFTSRPQPLISFSTLMTLTSPHSQLLFYLVPPHTLASTPTRSHLCIRSCFRPPLNLIECVWLCLRYAIERVLLDSRVGDSSVLWALYFFLVENPAVIASTLCDGAEAHNLPSLYLSAVLAPPTAEVKPRGFETAADVLTIYRSFAEGMYRVSQPSAFESPLCAVSLSSENTLSVMDPLCTLERRSISRPPFYLSAVLAPPAPQRCKHVGEPWVRYSPSRLLRKSEA
jgi:hypothetical protein